MQINSKKAYLFFILCQKPRLSLNPPIELNSKRLLVCRSNNASWAAGLTISPDEANNIRETGSHGLTWEARAPPQSFTPKELSRISLTFDPLAERAAIISHPSESDRLSTSNWLQLMHSAAVQPGIRHAKHIYFRWFVLIRMRGLFLQIPTIICISTFVILYNKANGKF